MKTGPIVCFGEVLWDLLPQGRFLGGAPLNVAYHLARLGQAPTLVSAVGDDALGRETRAAVKAAGLSDSMLAVHPTLPTGVVEVQLNAEGQAVYDIREGAAWDEIPGRPPRGSSPRALIFGSLSLRSPANRLCLRSWRAARPGLTVCDINLRPPYDTLEPLMPLLSGVDLLKLNGDEALRLTGQRAGQEDWGLIFARLSELFRCIRICVTLGDAGARLWVEGRQFHCPAPKVTVRDTIGAGDSFCAALVDGMLRHSLKPDWQALIERACRLGAFVASRDGAQPVYSAAEVLGFRQL